MSNSTTVHLRKVRSKTRRVQSENLPRDVAQVYTLCGKWETPAHVLREDNEKANAVTVTLCDECKAQRDLTATFGE